MSYRCSLCDDVVPGGTKVKRHVVKRPDGQIERELPVCSTCDALLRAGHRIEEVKKIVRDARGIATPLKVIVAQQQKQQTPTTEGASTDA